MVTACQPTGKTGDIIGKQPVKVENGIMTTEVLMAFGRVSDPVVSPDKSKILYGVSYENLEQNKSNRELFVVDIDGQNKKQITKINRPHQQADRRQQNIFHQRVNNFAKGCADDNTNSHINNITFEGKFLKFVQPRL